MADLLRGVFTGLAKGLWDSLVGTMKAYYLDQDKEKVSQTQTEQANTVLAQRRAQRTKPKETEKAKETKVLQRIFLCCAWNGGVFWLSIVIFTWILMPCLEFFTHLLFGGSSTHSIIWSYMGPTLRWMFNTLWILPLFALSKIVNGLWFQDIADAAYRKSRGRPQLPSLSKIIADLLFNLFTQVLFLIQGMLFMFLPIHGIGQFMSLLHMCLLYSLYAFEYKWFNMGWELPKRLAYIETNWPYFTGFGLPLAILTFIPQSYIISGCVFSILFPLFIISANEADPLERTCEYPLRLFSVAVMVTDSVFRHSLRKSSAGKTR